jgi:hypothetical protein
MLVVSALAACGGSRTHGPPLGGSTTGTDVQSGQLASVLSACEQNGGSSLLAASEDTDTSSVSDNAPTVCRCWTTWMLKNLNPGDQAAAVAAVEMSASFESLDVSLLDRLTRSLRACEPA